MESTQLSKLVANAVEGLFLLVFVDLQKIYLMTSSNN